MKNILITGMPRSGSTFFTRAFYDLQEVNLGPYDIDGKLTDNFKSKNLDFDTIANSDHEGFLRSMSNYQTFLFLPKVLETFSRICAEAKMMNLKVMTNKGLIGFFSEDYSTLQGQELIDCSKQKNSDALLLFEELIQ